jgi:chitinase
MDTIYYPGDRVQLQGTGYRAKWWTRGDDPAADVDNAWQSPWETVGAPTGTNIPATTAAAPAR